MDLKLLYLSPDHATLEPDDLSLFSELGIDWFSTGLYINPQKPITEHTNLQRKAINKNPDLNLIEEFNKINNFNKKQNGPTLVNKSFVDKFDVVLVNHICPWPYSLIANWEAIKHKPVIWRTYGQQQPEIELEIQKIRNKIKIVRGSKFEEKIKNCSISDYIIRVYIDENKFNNWSGDLKHVLTFNNYFYKRRWVSNTDCYFYVIGGLPHKLYGGNSDNHPFVSGFLNPEDQVKAYRSANVYFSLGTKPSSLTYNFLEAMMVGCPCITWGPELGNARGTYYDGTYEQSSLIENGVNGFWSDDLNKLRQYIQTLLTDKGLASEISKNARASMLKEFSKEKVKDSWKTLFQIL